jgi:hypothetical protein
MKIELFLVVIIFASCSLTKTNNNLIKLSDDKSIYYYEQEKPFVHLSLLGDYKFASFRTKYFRDIDKEFIDYSKHKFNNRKPTILYSAHTYVLPFYSTICILYKDTKFDTTALKNIKTDLKTILKTSFNKFVEIKCGTLNAYKITYQVISRITGIYTTNFEYFFAKGNNVYRLFLWTTNEDTYALTNEAEYIIREAKFE